MKNRIIISAIIFILILASNQKSSIATEMQTIEDTAKIAEILLKWNPGKLMPEESLLGTIIKQSNKKQIDFALLIYRDNDNSWKTTLNKKSFEQWQDFLIKQGGRWPEEGMILIITDKEDLPIGIPLDVPAFTQEFGENNKRMTISVLSKTAIYKQRLRPANFSDKALFEAVIATEICNALMIPLYDKERDQLCMSLGLVIGAIKMKLNYQQYADEISKMVIISDVPALIFSKDDYLKFPSLFEKGPIIIIK